MITVERSVLIQYRAAHIRAIVEDIERYPEFLPWCSEAKVLDRRGRAVVASLTLDFHGIRQTFATSNVPDGEDGLRMRLVSGPFRSLDGLWEFRALAADACKVSLRMDYEFSSAILGKAIGPVFKQVVSTLIEAFVGRAQQLAGQNQKTVEFRGNQAVSDDRG
jgi:ribosome-associated toxin RatA of RatAB toxin-antitoxin module